MKSVQSPCVKIGGDEIDKENKPMLSAGNAAKGARDVFSSDSDFVSKPVPLRKVRGRSNEDDSLISADLECVDTYKCELRRVEWY